MKTSILVVDDETDLSRQRGAHAAPRGLRGRHAGLQPDRGGGAARGHDAFDAAFLDITMPEMDGLDVLKVIKERSPETECVMVTANESIPLVIKAIKTRRLRLPGQADHPGPADPRPRPRAGAQAADRVAAAALVARGASGPWTTRTPSPRSSPATSAMLRLLHEAELHAASDIPILVTGETGVGKELLARAIHLASRRAERALRAGQHAGAVAHAVRVGVLRARQGRLHRRGPGQGRATWARPPAARCSSTRSAISRSRSRASCCASCRRASTRRWATRSSIRADVRFVAATNQDLDKLVAAAQVPQGPVLPAAVRPPAASRRCASGATT